MTTALRVLLFAVAMLGILWLGRSLGPVQDERAAVTAVTVADGRPSRAQIARAYRLLERSAARTRSSAPDVRLAQLDAFTGRPDRVVRRLRPVVRREPENLEAWILMAQSARTIDPPLAARARERALRLSPPLPG